MKIGWLNREVSRLEGDVCVGTQYCEHLYTENQRYKSKYEAELEDKARIFEKLERSEDRNDSLQRVNLKFKGLLAAAESELSVLKDPKVSRLGTACSSVKFYQDCEEERGWERRKGELKEVETRVRGVQWWDLD